MDFIDRLRLTCPIIQAPMAGVSTPELAATVSNAGGLGSLGVGATNAAGARALVDATRRLTSRPFNVNVFVHAPAVSDPDREQAWLAAMSAEFARHGGVPPTSLRPIYKSFVDDDDMLATLVELAPPVVSFHFGIPSAKRIAALKLAGCMLLSTVTNLAEAQAAQEAGIDAVVAQGFEAGGHRGVFNPTAQDDCLTTMALTRLLVVRCRLPVVAAGGMMDGRGVAAALALGAVAAQLGTAFVACPESGADAAYRQALAGPGAAHTTMTRVISGRPARCLNNRFTAWGLDVAELPCPDYPITYDAGKALHAAAKATGENGFGAHWAGQGAPLLRVLPAARLVRTLAAELAGAS